MPWEFGFLVLSLAAVISDGLQMDEIGGIDGLDFPTSAVINKSDSLPSRNLELGADENLLNNEEGMPEEAAKFADEYSMDERRSCTPTISCSMLNGYCVKKSSKCNGTLDKWGCRGKKKCKCCIPVQTTPAPCSTTTTSPGPTVNPPLPWVSVGEDRFVVFRQGMKWDDARQLCQDNSLDLFHPKNSTAVAIYLQDIQDNWFSSHFWLGARGNTTAQVWVDGGILTWADPWRPHYGNPYYWFNNGSSDCLAILTDHYNPRNGTVLLAIPNGCSGYRIPFLCG